MERITSRKNPYIMRLRQLALDASARRESGETVLDGLKLLGEALASGAEVTGAVFAEGAALPEGLECPVYAAPAELLAYASPVKNSPGPVFSVRMPRPEAPEAPDCAVVLENMQDPGNVGTLIRTANALGIDLVVLCGECADRSSPRAVRASMGAAFRQYVRECSVEDLPDVMRGLGLTLYGAALSASARAPP